MKQSPLKLFSTGLVILGILFLGIRGTVSAAPITFDFTFSGESFNNTATATGFITATDATVFLNPGYEPNLLLPNPFISALSVTVSGASSGNGTFGLLEFVGISWGTGIVPLDFTKELVGQPTGIPMPWGTPDGPGDFLLFGLAPPAPSPYGVLGPFTLGANWGQGDLMFLTSMKAREVGAVPEPATMLLLGSGLLGLWGARRKFKK